MATAADRVALVTGGARGIGAGIAARLAAQDWRVVIADRDKGIATPPGGRSIVCDVSDASAVAHLVQDVAATEQRLDALICNAGFMIRKPLGT